MIKRKEKVFIITINEKISIILYISGHLKPAINYTNKINKLLLINLFLYVRLFKSRQLRAHLKIR